MHIALQGCLKGGAIDYGVTADTGGHIRYVLELVKALEQQGVRQTIVTRRFVHPGLGPVYAAASEPLSALSDIHRITGSTTRYLPKESLYRERRPMLENLLNWLSTLDPWPDLIHAHYADAGVLAAAVKSELGIPYVFTPHSLGAVKARNLACDHKSSVRAALSRRVDDEQRAISLADAVIVSSTDEARQQLGLYRARPDRVLINAPGCELTAFKREFSPEAFDSVRRLIDPDLHSPDKPLLLAVARPVWRKNLHRLLEAYARSDALQARANLAILAGRQDPRTQPDEEGMAVVTRLHDLVGRHSLDGKVSLPITHEMAQVPALFALARERGGVFVNVASSEPFGLTILEAAAAGLPTLATVHGGCAETVDFCRHGELVDPDDQPALITKLVRLLSDSETWRRYSAAGQARVDHYRWSRHARQYMEDGRDILSDYSRTSRRASMPPRRYERFVVADMDGTLLGDDPDAARALKRWFRMHADVGLIVATGRRASVALAMLQRADACMPQAIIGAMGSEICPVVEGRLQSQRHDGWWMDRVAWDRRASAEVLSDIDGLTLQRESEQTAWKLSYTAPDARALVPIIEERLAARALCARIVVSHATLIDILPPGGGKAAAAEYYCLQQGVPRARLFGAGDSGNDVDLLRRCGQAVVVGNHHPELESLRSLPSVYFASAPATAGVLEGLHRWLGGDTDTATDIGTDTDTACDSDVGVDVLADPAVDPKQVRTVAVSAASRATTCRAARRVI